MDDLTNSILKVAEQYARDVGAETMAWELYEMRLAGKRPANRHVEALVKLLEGTADSIFVCAAMLGRKPDEHR